MGDGDRPTSQEGRPRRTGQARPLVYQGVVALLGLGAFLVLLDVLVDYGHPVLSGIVPRLARGTWIALLLTVLAALLVVQVLLLRLAAKSMEPSLRALAQEAFDIVQPASAGGILLIGCPGCGTAFEHDARPEAPDTFECPNCRRVGRLASDAPRRNTHVSELPCVRCGNVFKAYRESAECPVCHTRQQA